MKIILFAKRNAKEILRDPLNLCFGFGFPLILLVLLSFINSAIPEEANNTMFEINNLAPGLAMFGTAFMSLFTGMLIAKDRSTSFLARLFASPMTSFEFLMGYTLPVLLISLIQSTITLLVSLAFGLTFSVNIFVAILLATLTSLLFIGVGLLCGSAMSEKAVGGICGALMTNLTGWLSGVFVPIALIGGAFESFCQVLPFYQSLQAISLALSGSFASALPHLGITLAYSVAIFTTAIFAFKHKMRCGR